MGGVFGGMLSLIEPVGGVVLYFLIGEKAWKDSGGGRFARLAFGAIFIGMFLGAMIGATVGMVLSLFAPAHEAGIPLTVVSMLTVGFVGWLVGLIGLPLFVFVLEMIRRALEDDEPWPHSLYVNQLHSYRFFVGAALAGLWHV